VIGVQNGLGKVIGENRGKMGAITADNLTRDTIIALREKYKQFRREAWKNFATNDVDFIDCALLEKEQDVTSSRRKVEALQTKVQGTTNLVSPASIRLFLHLLRLTS